MYVLMYNDCINVFYVVLCFYLFILHKSIQRSALMFSFALGIKTGVLALLPGYLGCVMWQYGKYSLLKVVAVILVYQVVTALPIVNDFGASIVGFKQGANTAVTQYLGQSTLISAYDSSLKMRAAGHKNSVFWKWAFNSWVEYNQYVLTSNSVQAILVLNVYYFFVRRLCGL